MIRFIELRHRKFHAPVDQKPIKKRVSQVLKVVKNSVEHIVPNQAVQTFSHIKIVDESNHSFYDLYSEEQHACDDWVLEVFEQLAQHALSQGERVPEKNEKHYY